MNAFGVVRKQNSWYLVGRLESGLRIYRISRMSNPVVLNERFERRSNFEPWLAGASGGDSGIDG